MWNTLNEDVWRTAKDVRIAELCPIFEMAWFYEIRPLTTLPAGLI
jgi:hypothetical protein